ncbi:Membrane protein involved in the export of O-antigen and teichoic acid [Devosia lucknowensis]|uniref:Membrane protein involved in the export of O-antigen and teichoic acid n=1 Tax=Devosia lucknowensis TaxID=1096929 RepID=A0A1Y6F649_9HYPH|nr:oligosaccharide flippase family protein [Devosia lucknowensis]SMQ70304.1 Membrane protein involved in the export of O-antigen and teichoic acid [Devosia lucknowensis]
MSERAGTLDAVIALAIRILGAGLVFGLQVLLARLLPEEGYGGFVTLWTWMLALGSFAALGFAESSLRFLPRYQLRGRHTILRGYWRFGLRTVVGAGLGLVLLGGLVATGMGLDGPGMTILLIGLGLPVLGLEYYFEGVARSFGWFRLAALPVYVIRPVLIGGTCVLLHALGVELSLPIVGAVLIGSMGLVVAVMAWQLSHRLRRLDATRMPASAKQKRLWLAASLPLLVLSGLDDLTSYADVLVLSLMVPPELVGMYFAAARALALAGFVAYAMTLVAGRRFAVDLASSDRQVLQASVLQSTRLTLWATVAAVALTLMAGPWLLGAFGDAYEAGYPVMLILGAGMVLRAMSGQAGEALIVLGRQREGLLVGCAVLGLTASLAAILVPGFGILGAALASAAAMAGRTLALVMVLWRTDRLRVFSLRLPSLASA